MDWLQTQINEKRKLRPTSLKNYIFNLGKLHSIVKSGKTFDNADWVIENKKELIEYLNKQKITTRKTLLAAIVVLLSSYGDKYQKDLDEYRDIMILDSQEYRKTQLEQKKSKTESENWATLKTLQGLLNNYRNELETLNVFKKSKDEITAKNFDLLQMYVLGSLYISDDDNPPLRNEYGNMKVIGLKEFNALKDTEKKDNYLVVVSPSKKFYSLGDYKTSSTYGEKRIYIGKKLNAILNIWLHYNTSGWLLVNTKGGKLGTNNLTKYLNKVFKPTGKENISSTMLRHIYISEKIGGPTYDEKQELAEKMNHSVGTQEIYRKK